MFYVLIFQLAYNAREMLKKGGRYHGPQSYLILLADDQPNVVPPLVRMYLEEGLAPASVK